MYVAIQTETESESETERIEMHKVSRSLDPNPMTKVTVKRTGKEINTYAEPREIPIHSLIFGNVATHLCKVVRFDGTSYVL